MSDDEKRMTFTEHLAELRIRIIRIGVAVAMAMVLCYIASNKINEALLWPLLPIQGAAQEATSPSDATAPSESPAPKPPAGSKDKEVSVTLLNPLEIVFVQLRTAGYAGIVLALPYVLWQIGAFVFPGLKPNERKAVRILVVGCSILAICGVAVAYFGILPVVLPYLRMWVPEGWTIQMRANETISIVIKFLAGFAIAFQFPMVTLVLVYLDLLSPLTLRQYRKIAIVGIAVASAVLTPPDPGSMIIMMMPLLLLYEVSIWLSYLVVRRRKNPAATS